jgi:hypothetical protein
MDAWRLKLLLKFDFFVVLKLAKDGYFLKVFGYKSFVGVGRYFDTIFKVVSSKMCFLAIFDEVEPANGVIY